MQSKRDDQILLDGLRTAYARYNFVVERELSGGGVIQNPGGLLWNTLIKAARELPDGHRDTETLELFEGILDDR